MGTDPPPAIDLPHLGTYTLGDKALELELLTMFLPNAQGYVDAMAAQSGTTYSGAAWWVAAHGLKGVALGVGATELAALAADAETLKEAPAKTRREHSAALQDALGRVRRFVADLH